ncbi:MAG: alkaline phosphatase family protein, partial [Planctomycetota bacterium]
MAAIEKVAVFGLDCAEPSLTFERWIDDLPNLKGLMDGGTYGTLTSCIPPITVPAWSCMAASKDPGTLGIYGFRNRKDHSYDNLFIATSLAVREKRIWDILGEHGLQSIVVGVPGTYPITHPVAGQMITGFLTPDTRKNDFTWPPSLKHEISNLIGEYMVDVAGFRTDDKQWLLDQIFEMTDQRFKVIKYLLETKAWDLLWLVEIGLDRIHHGFWAFMDPNHHRYEAGNRFEGAIHDYLVHLDTLVGEVLAQLDLNKTAVWVVSDHGAKCMAGGFCLNAWLMQEGYLHLTQPPKPGQAFDTSLVDWPRTVAWGEGGYYGRLFLNVQGREPEGVIPAGDYEKVRTELKDKLETHPDHEGRPMGTKAYRPEELYTTVNRIAPDLVVIFGDLRWRSVGSLGLESVYTFENDTGPDDANHAQDGLYIVSHPSLAARGRVDGPTLYDVAP